MFDKEEIYDKEIAPLMAKIIEVCKRENLPMTSQFYLKQQHPEAESENAAMFCTTVVIPKKEEMFEEHHQHMKYVAEAMRYGPNGKPFVMATTIRT